MAPKSIRPSVKYTLKYVQLNFGPSDITNRGKNTSLDFIGRSAFDSANEVWSGWNLDVSLVFSFRISSKILQEQGKVLCIEVSLTCKWWFTLKCLISVSFLLALWRICVSELSGKIAKRNLGKNFANDKTYIKIFSLKNFCFWELQSSYII